MPWQCRSWTILIQRLSETLNAFVAFFSLTSVTLKKKRAPDCWLAFKVESILILNKLNLFFRRLRDYTRRLMRQFAPIQSPRLWKERRSQWRSAGTALSSLCPSAKTVLLRRKHRSSRNSRRSKLKKPASKLDYFCTFILDYLGSRSCCALYYIIAIYVCNTWT